MTFSLPAFKRRASWRWVAGWGVGLPWVAAGTLAMGTGARAIDGEIATIETRMLELASPSAHIAGGTVGFRTRHIPAESGNPRLGLAIDLGQNTPVDRVVLVPAQMPSPSGSVPFGFPRRFRILAGRDPVPGEEDVVYDSGEGTPADPGIYPVVIPVAAQPFRYLRIEALELEEGRRVRCFALAEVFAFAGERNVALHKSVAADQAQVMPRLFDPAYAVDGATPLGQPERNGPPPRLRCWQLNDPVAGGPPIHFDFTFPAPVTIDEMRLYSAWQADNQDRPNDLPETVELRVPANGDGWRTAYAGKHPDNRFPGNNPLVHVFNPVSGHRFRVVISRSSQPTTPLSIAEIELLDKGHNTARNAAVAASDGTVTAQTGTVAINDGCTSFGPIIPLRQWLEELAERHTLETRLAGLRAERAARETALRRLLLAATAGLACLAATAAALAVRGYAMRRRQLRELQHRIASDLHDEVGSNLACITLLAGHLKQQHPHPRGSDGTLDEIIEVARETAETMRDIIWMLDPGRKLEGTLEARLREIAGRILRGIDFTLSVDAVKPPRQWPMDTTRHFVLFYKEALHNIRKHNIPNRVEILLERRERREVLVIRDDGVPFRPGSPPAALRDRAACLRARLEILPRPDGSGNCLCLDIPLKHGTLAGAPPLP